MLSSEPGHSVSHPEAWHQTKTKGLALLLISTTCVFVIQSLQPKMISCVPLRFSVTIVLQRHPWYLTEELISLSLFDTKLPDETLNVLAQKIA